MTTFADNLRNTFSLAATEASFEGDKDALAIYESLEAEVTKNAEEEPAELATRLRSMLVADIKCEGCPYKHAAYDEALVTLDDFISRNQPITR